MVKVATTKIHLQFFWVFHSQTGFKLSPPPPGPPRHPYCKNCGDLKFLKIFTFFSSLFFFFLTVSSTQRQPLWDCWWGKLGNLKLVPYDFKLGLNCHHHYLDPTSHQYQKAWHADRVKISSKKLLHAPSGAQNGNCGCTKMRNSTKKRSQRESWPLGKLEGKPSEIFLRCPQGPLLVSDCRSCLCRVIRPVWSIFHLGGPLGCSSFLVLVVRLGCPQSSWYGLVEWVTRPSTPSAVFPASSQSSLTAL